MDILKTINFEKCDLSINIESITGGWMELKILTPGSILAYEVSYICEPFSDLTALAYLLIHEKSLVSMAPNPVSSEHYCSICHCCEQEGSYYWLFVREKQNLKIVCLHNAFDVLCELSAAYFDQSLFEIWPDNLDWRKKIKFAVQGTITDFVTAVLDAVKISSPEFDKNEWPFRLDQHKIQSLKNYKEAQG